MLVAQIAAGLAVGMPFPGAPTGQPFIATSTPIKVPGLAFVAVPGEKNVWLINDKGFVVRSFPTGTKPEEIVAWRQESSLPIGYTAPDPRSTISVLPSLTAPVHWMDVVLIGMRLGSKLKPPTATGEKGLLLLFLSTYGPADHLYAERLNAIHRAAANAGISTLGLFSGKAETKQTVVRFSTLMSLEFPCALDSGNAYADAFRASRTPEAFLLDTKKRVVYTGAIDTSTFGGASDKPYLMNAVLALGAGSRIAVQTTRVFGTPIDR